MILGSSKVDRSFESEKKVRDLMEIAQMIRIISIIYARSRLSSAMNYVAKDNKIEAF